MYEVPKVGSVLLAGSCGFYVYSMGSECRVVDALHYFFVAGYTPLLIFGLDKMMSSYSDSIKRRTVLCELRGGSESETHRQRLLALDDAVHDAIMPSIMGAGWGIVAYSLGYCGMKFIDSFSR